MAGAKIEKHIVGPVSTNCYFIINSDTDEAIIIDPGAEPKYLVERIEDSRLRPVAILLTHGHFDHAGAAEELKKKYGIKIYAFEGERETLKNPIFNLSGDMFSLPEEYSADEYLKDNEKTTLAGLTFTTLHTPGHTPGGCGFYFSEEKILFAGDSLFYGSVGRTDFPGGSMSQLVRSIKEKFFTLPEDTVVFTGHGEETTIGFEKDNNPFIN
ncbi:MAG: MBL fold metallo-hydrolase [Lachnospiraceae bacterium]|nr:MBL fold metallo-hydrolase [Lachnospiraceae bacterium]